MSGALRVSEPVMRALDAAVLDGPQLRLQGQLDLALYAQVAKVIEAAGGTWNRKAGAHVFEGSAAEAIELILLTGEVKRTKQEFGQFYTPDDVARRVIHLAQIEPGMRVLEPSAGRGALAFPAAAAGGQVFCYEIDEKTATDLVWANGEAPSCLDMVVQHDFLTTRPSPLYDRVVMNPPFALQADIRHVMHAVHFLKPDGLLVAIMSLGVRFRENALAREFRDLVERRGGTFEDLPAGAFKASGTQVSACIVTIPGVRS